MSDYTFELARSTDLSKIGEMTQARDRELILTHNKAGSFTATLPLDDEIAGFISEVSTCVLIKLNGVEQWSGPIWTIQEQTPNSIAIGAVGWLQTLEKRISKQAWGLPTLQYSAQDAGVIAFDLLTRSNNDSSFDLDYVTPGMAELTFSRTRAYAPYISILTEISALSSIENGYDMIVDPVTRQLNIFKKLGQIRDQVVFDYDLNLTGAGRNSDASKICNRMIAYSSIGAAVAEDPNSLAAFGPFEEAVSLSDVVDISILQAYADGEVGVRSIPLDFHDFSPKQYTDLMTVPRIFRDFNVGDIAYLDVRKGRMQIKKQPVRIFGATVSFKNNGQEQLTSIKTTPDN